MACDSIQEAFATRVATQLAPSFGGDGDLARDALLQVYELAATRAATPSSGGWRATLATRAADAQAREATIAVFRQIRSMGLSLPAHGDDDPEAGMPLPKRAAQHGWRAVADTLTCAREGCPLPELAREVRAGMIARDLPGVSTRLYARHMVEEAPDLVALANDPNSSAALHAWDVLRQVAVQAQTRASGSHANEPEQRALAQAAVAYSPAWTDTHQRLAAAICDAAGVERCATCGRHMAPGALHTCPESAAQQPLTPAAASTPVDTLPLGAVVRHATHGLTNYRFLTRAYQGRNLVERAELWAEGRRHLVDPADQVEVVATPAVLGPLYLERLARQAPPEHYVALHTNRARAPRDCVRPAGLWAPYTLVATPRGLALLYGPAGATAPTRQALLADGTHFTLPSKHHLYVIADPVHYSDWFLHEPEMQLRADLVQRVVAAPEIRALASHGSHSAASPVPEPLREAAQRAQQYPTTPQLRERGNALTEAIQHNDPTAVATAIRSFAQLVVALADGTTPQPEPPRESHQYVM